MSGEYVDRLDEAWSAIAEHLYTVDEHPAKHDLVRVGQQAILDALAEHRHHHGFYRHKTDGAAHGAGSSPAFVKYWLEFAAWPTASCERRVVENYALLQILPMLSDVQHRVLVALAVHEDYQAASDAVGMTYDTFKSHVSKARRRFLALWHEGEQPSRPWGCDRRVGSRAVGRSETYTRRELFRRRRDAARATTQSEVTRD
jgi:hypothetical protein